MGESFGVFRTPDATLHSNALELVLVVPLLISGILRLVQGYQLVTKVLPLPSSTVLEQWCRWPCLSCVTSVSFLEFVVFSLRLRLGLRSWQGHKQKRNVNWHLQHNARLEFVGVACWQSERVTVGRGLMEIAYNFRKVSWVQHLLINGELQNLINLNNLIL